MTIIRKSYIRWTTLYLGNHIYNEIVTSAKSSLKFFSVCSLLKAMP